MSNGTNRRTSYDVEPQVEEQEHESAPSQEQRRSYFKRHPRAKWGLLIAAIIAVGVAFYFWHYYSIRESTDDAEVNAHIDPVSARVSGTVIQVSAEENQYVKQGQVLVQLDPRDFQVALERARAELADAQATAAAARSGVPVTRATSSGALSSSQAQLAAAQRDAQAARARVAEAQANYNNAAANLKRMAQLIAKDEISQQQYDATLTAEQAAGATLNAAQAAAASWQSRVAQAQAGVRAAQAGPSELNAARAKAAASDAVVQRYQAAVAQGQLDLQYTTIRAPVSGVLGKRNVEPGQVVQAGQPLFAVVNLGEIWITANFKETQLNKMHPGQPVTVHVDAYSRDFKGHVDSIGGATGARFSLLPPENATGNYVKVVQRVPVKIVLDPGQDKEGLLRPGMSVEPTVFVNK